MLPSRSYWLHENSTSNVEEPPFVTSRDTTAAGFLSEVGLSPFDVDDVAMVIRAFPIRVGGNSGPLPNEIDWETISNECGKKTICEWTSVTKHIRRVARFDSSIVKRAIQANNPSLIVLNHLDYLTRRLDRDCNAISSFSAQIEWEIGQNIDLLGVGPSCRDLWER